MAELLMATRDDGTEPEAEPVLVTLEDGTAIVILDDGTCLTFDAEELRQALNGEDEYRDLKRRGAA